MRVLVVLVASMAAVVSARAADLPALPPIGTNPESTSTPTITVDPQSPADYWKGFYVGSAMTASR